MAPWGWGSPPVTDEEALGHPCWCHSPSISWDPWVLEKDQFVIQSPQGEFWSFPGGSYREESTCNEGDLGSIPPWVGRRAWPPTPVFLPGESPWQRSPAGYSPGGCKEPDSTESLSRSSSSSGGGRVNSQARRMNRIDLVLMGSQEERRVPPSGKVLGGHPSRRGPAQSSSRPPVILGGTAELSLNPFALCLVSGASREPPGWMYSHGYEQTTWTWIFSASVCTGRC